MMKIQSGKPQITTAHPTGGISAITASTSENQPTHAGRAAS